MESSLTCLRPLLALLPLVVSCNFHRGIPADQLCAQIESASDCDTEDCVTVACYYDFANNTAELQCHHAATEGVVFVQGTMEAVSEIGLDKCHWTDVWSTQLCPDTGSPADVYVGCLDRQPYQ